MPVAIITGDHCVKDALATEMQELGAALFFKPLWVEDIVDLTRTLLESLQPACDGTDLTSARPPHRQQADGTD